MRICIRFRDPKEKVQHAQTSRRIEKWISWVARANIIKSASCHKTPIWKIRISWSNPWQMMHRRYRVKVAKYWKIHTKPYMQWRVLGSYPSRFLWRWMKDIILCSPLPGTFASERITFRRTIYKWCRYEKTCATLRIKI
jgi:hypothetical protein